MPHTSRFRKKIWEMSDERKMERQTSKLTGMVREAIMTGDRQKYDKLVNILSNAATSNTTLINKEMMVEVLCDTINWAIERIKSVSPE